jgi:hypothetical protein
MADSDRITDWKEFDREVAALGNPGTNMLALVEYSRKRDPLVRRAVLGLAWLISDEPGTDQYGYTDVENLIDSVAKVYE